jgi:cobalt-zinc-cadmium efflux system protein
MSAHSHHDHDHDHVHDHEHDHAADAKGESQHGHAGHQHATPPAGFDRAFALGSALNAAFVIGEFGFGWVAHSVALMADAAHNLGDVLGLLLAWWAVSLGRRQPTRQRTYGLGRSSILASLTNAVVLLVGVGGITLEAISRLIEGVPADAVGSQTVMVVAVVGIVINGITAWMFARGRQGDLNVRGAFLHMAADAAVSAGVVLGGLAIYLTGWGWIDPLVSLLIAALILISTWSLLRDSLNLALDKVPEHIDGERVLARLTALPGVSEVHDLHIWALSTTETALTAHLIRPGSSLDDAFLHQAQEMLQTDFAIGHATLQIERGDHGTPCQLAPAHVV